MNDGDLAREPRKEERLFHRGVAAADHYNFFPTEKESIAGRAGRNAVTNQLLFVGQPEPARRSSTGDDQRIGMDLVLANVQDEGAVA